MPTGYTADLYDGKDQTFEEFVMTCARAFGATITLRDAPLGPDIPEFEVSDYYSERILKTEQQLGELRRMSAGAASKAFVEERAKWDASEAEALAVSRERAARYGAMLGMVKAWEPPTVDHTPLKDFMIDQLEESIRFDSSSPHPWPYETVEGWLADRLARAERDMEYSLEEHAKEVERVNGRNAWVSALRSSLLVAARANGAARNVTDGSQ